MNESDRERDSEEVDFVIKCRMKRRWARPFLCMLEYMECCGDIGHSSMVGLFADGDGDFHPKFEVSGFEKFPPQPPKFGNYSYENVMFDSDVTAETMKFYADKKNREKWLQDDEKKRCERWLKDWSKEILGYQWADGEEEK